MIVLPDLIDLNKQKQFRIIPSTYPPINFFEHLVDPDEMETLWEIESLTNERLRQEVGDLFLVPSQERISGPGSSVIMAAFTHLSRPTRFTDGSYGVYYASLSKETAIKETVYHRERFLKATCEPALELVMRLYEGKITKPLHDIRKANYTDLHHPQDYTAAQVFGRELRAKQSWGLIYNSVRDPGGACVAAFKPKTVSIPQQTSHFKYLWNGEMITEVLDMKTVLQF